MWKVQCIFLRKLRPDRCLIGENRWRNSWETLIRLKVVWRQIKWRTISSIQPAGGNEGVVWQCRWIINDTSWNLLLACASPIFGRNPEQLPHESGAAKLRTDVNVFLFWESHLMCGKIGSELPMEIMFLFVICHFRRCVSISRHANVDFCHFSLLIYFMNIK